MLVELINLSDASYVGLVLVESNTQNLTQRTKGYVVVWEQVILDSLFSLGCMGRALEILYERSVLFVLCRLLWMLSEPDAKSEEGAVRVF